MRIKDSSNRPRKAKNGGIESKDVMTKVTHFAENAPNLPFTEFDIYDLYRRTFIDTELGRMKSLLPLREKAENLGLTSMNMMPKRGRKTYFTPEGKVALMFLKLCEAREAVGVTKSVATLSGEMC